MNLIPPEKDMEDEEEEEEEEEEVEKKEEEWDTPQDYVEERSACGMPDRIVEKTKKGKKKRSHG